MTPSGPDLKIVADRLAIVDASLQQLRALPTESLEAFLADARTLPASESLLRRSLEALLDVARHLLAKGFGEGPLEYRQVARRTAERGLVRDPEVAEVFLRLAGYRNRLTHFYAEITPEELFDIVSRRLDDVAAVAGELRQAAARIAAATSP